MDLREGVAGLVPAVLGIGALRFCARGRSTATAARIGATASCRYRMNVQVHRAVSDLAGQPGMLIARAIVSGERFPQQLAELRHSLWGHMAEHYLDIGEREY